MKIIMEIPKEFEAQFNNDRFKDSLERLHADIGGYGVSGLYEIELCDMLIEAFEDAIQIEEEV